MVKVKPTTLLKVVLIGVVFDLVVSAVVAYGVIRDNRSASDAHIARVAVYEQCLSGNAFRADDAKLWGNVVALINSPDAKGFDERVLALVKQADSPRVCKAP